MVDVGAQRVDRATGVGETLRAEIFPVIAGDLHGIRQLVAVARPVGHLRRRNVARTVTFKMAGERHQWRVRVGVGNVPEAGPASDQRRRMQRGRRQM